jgi:uncharacterized protein (DUF362 family)
MPGPNKTESPTAKSPEKAVTTNLLWFRLLPNITDYSCSITIGDSPGYGSIIKVLKSSGIMDIIKDLNLNISISSIILLNILMEYLL